MGARSTLGSASACARRRILRLNRGLFVRSVGRRGYLFDRVHDALEPRLDGRRCGRGFGHRLIEARVRSIRWAVHDGVWRGRLGVLLRFRVAPEGPDAVGQRVFQYAMNLLLRLGRQPRANPVGDHVPDVDRHGLELAYHRVDASVVVGLRVVKRLSLELHPKQRTGLVDHPVDDSRHGVLVPNGV